MYVLALYNGPWGSPLDILSAFAVGFAGKVAIDFGTSGIKVHDDTGDAPGKKPAIKAPPIVEQRAADADVPVGAHN